MPLSLKKVLFPMNPICHILPNSKQKEEKLRLWELSEGIMSDVDFRTQYMLEWVAALMAFLQLYDQQLLFESSTHENLNSGLGGEDYWFGLDCAGASNPYTNASDKDVTALSIWARRDGRKQKVFCDELYSANPDELISWLDERVHPSRGWFRCKYGGVDVTRAVGAYSAEKLAKSEIPVIPIFYNKTEEVTRKNYKNALFEYFKIENSAGRVQYPSQTITDGLDPLTTRPLNPTWYTARESWEVIEREDRGGLNARIEAPHGHHDDHPNADALGVFCMDRPGQFPDELRRFRKRPRPILSQGPLGTSTLARATSNLNMAAGGMYQG
jgi:hypothetical protein